MSYDWSNYGCGACRRKRQLRRESRRIVRGSRDITRKCNENVNQSAIVPNSILVYHHSTRQSGVMPCVLYISRGNTLPFIYRCSTSLALLFRQSIPVASVRSAFGHAAFTMRRCSTGKHRPVYCQCLRPPGNRARDCARISMSALRRTAEPPNRAKTGFRADAVSSRTRPRCAWRVSRKIQKVSAL